MNTFHIREGFESAALSSQHKVFLMLPPEILEAFASFDEKYPFHFVLNLLLPPENLEAFPTKGGLFKLNDSLVPNASLNSGYVLGQEDETYSISAAHGYFGRLIFQFASFNNSRALHFFLAFWPLQHDTLQDHQCSSSQ